MHGHQIRRAAQVDRTELWADVKPGSLYGALHRMADEGVVEVVRTEQEGNMPARTVYALTAEGRGALAAHRDAALREIRLPPDPVDLALQYTQDLAEEELRAVLVARRTELAARLVSWRSRRDAATPYLTGLEPMTFDHILFRLEAELAWHDKLLEELPKLLSATDQEQP